MKKSTLVRAPLAAAAASFLALALPLGSSATTSTRATTPVKRHIMRTVQEVQRLRATNAIGVPCEVECVGPMLSGGGPIQHTPSVYIVFWGWHGSDPAGESAYLQSFFNGVGGSGWANIQTQYSGSNGYVTNPGGQLKGVWNDDSTTPPTVILDSAIGDEAVKAAQHFGFSPDADYFVATPHGTGTSGFASTSSTGYCAYHDSRVTSFGTVAYTNFPYIPDAGAACGQNFVNANGPLDGVSMVGGHEYAEAVTDPVVGTGWTDLTGNETGDKCAWIAVGPGTAANISLSTGTFAVQSLFSNAANLGTIGGCVLSYP